MSAFASEFNWPAYAICILGIVISVLLPPLWAIVTEYFKPAPAGVSAKSLPELAAAGWEVFRPYAALGAASALTALLLVAFVGDKLTSFGAALLAGYAWDSTLQKLSKPAAKS